MFFFQLNTWLRSNFNLKNGLVVYMTKRYVIESITEQTSEQIVHSTLGFYTIQHFLQMRSVLKS